MRSSAWILVTALFLLAAPVLVRAEDPPPPDAAAPLAEPSAAWSTLNADVRKLPYAQRRSALKRGAEDYLGKWKVSGQTPTAQQLYSLGLMARSAERWSEAAGSFTLAAIGEGVPADVANAAASAEASLYSNSAAREALGREHTAKALKRLLAHAAGMTDEKEQSMRGSMQTTLASILDATDRKPEARELRLALARRDPTMVGRVYRSLVWGLLEGRHAMADYEPLRAEAAPMLSMLREQQAKAVSLAQAKLDAAKKTLLESKPDALDAEGNLASKERGTWTPLERAYDGVKRQVAGAESMLTRLGDAGKPFEMLGKPAPAWTLEHAFGSCSSLEDLEGKVVVMDFWATWCPWCIRSFPAIRDLLKEYETKGLTFVGVTASSSSVYAARYDLDDDLKDKATPGERAQAAARLARGAQKPDGVTVFDAEAYPAREREVIAQFIENHKMTWPVVMIDKAEPGPKYALRGWPHAVVLDRQGRVRYFKSGALLRDRPEAVAAFKKVLEDLLAEEAPKPGQ